MMKRKLMSILLALALCLPLAGSAFAEGEAETPAPGEQTETLPVEAETPASEDVTEPEGEAPPADKPAPEEKEEAAVEEDVWIYGHFHCVEEVAEEDGTTWQMGYLCYDASCQYLHGLQAADILSRTEKGLLANCAVCGRNDWGPEVVANTLYYDTENPDTHQKQENIVRYCQTTGCSGCAARLKPKEEVAHSWTKTATENYSSNGVDTHTATCTYTCVCDATKTETEEHRQENAGYSGSNYHSGRFHYVGYRYVCKEKCGYTTITYEPTPCPGRNDGTGCVFFVNKVDPPVEVQDVTIPEETTPPGDMTEPEETAPPTDAANPKGPTPLPAEETQEYNRYQAGKAIELYTGDPMAMKSANNIADGNTMAIVPDHDHVKVYTKLLKFWYEISREQHKYCEQYETRCIYCESDGTSNEYGDWEPHSWTKTATGNYTNNGSDHAAEYTYTCTVCGYTKTEPESEEHSYLSKPTVSYQSNGSTHTATYTYTCVCDATKTETEEHGQENAGYSGSNYHSGRFHYVGYRYVCKEKCGYTTITYEPTPCPGRNDGTGCVFFVNKVDPPVEVQDVTVPDEEAPPEDVAEPGEAVPPGDGEAPGETAPPGDEASPGEADPPGGMT